MSEATEGQALNITASMAVDTRWPEIDRRVLQLFIELPPEERGKRFTTFLKNGGKVLVGEQEVITINHGSFNSAEFIGKDYGVLDDETDPCSTSLSELDLARVQFVTMLEGSETRITGEEKLKRLKKKEDYIRLDADVFLTFWRKKDYLPEGWKKKVNGHTRHIFFDGTVLRDTNGNRYVLGLYWLDDRWFWDVYRLDRYWRESYLSAVLAPAAQQS